MRKSGRGGGDVDDEEWKRCTEVIQMMRSGRGGGDIDDEEWKR